MAWRQNEQRRGISAYNRKQRRHQHRQRRHERHHGEGGGNKAENRGGGSSKYRMARQAMAAAIMRGVSAA